MSVGTTMARGDFTGCSLTKTGLQFDNTLTAENWEAVGDFLGKSHGAVQFWIGDWIIRERMYPVGTRVELFCRKPQEGWEVWGNQV